MGLELSSAEAAMRLPFAKRCSVVPWVFFCIGLLLASRVYAQVAGAMLKGSVTDATGATVPKAQVSITDVATGIAHNVTTDAAGTYSAANLRPGDYQVRVTATGFAVEVRSGITLTVGAQQVLDISLRVGQMSQVVEVAGEAPTVELASSEISAEITSATVRELPLNGRSWTSLAATRRVSDQYSAKLHGWSRPWQSWFWIADFSFWFAAPDGQLPLGWRHHERLLECRAWKRNGREVGSRCRSGILRHLNKPGRGIRQDGWRRRECHHQIGY